MGDGLGDAEDPEAAAMELDRAVIRDALQKTIPQADTGALVTGWVVVAEFMDTKGGRWLTRYWDGGMTKWQRQGFLYNALNDTDWQEEVDDG